MTKQLLTITISEQELANLEAYCQQTQRTKSDIITEYLRSLSKRPREHLLSEISKLSRELEQVKQEKAELETLLETSHLKTEIPHRLLAETDFSQSIQEIEPLTQILSKIPTPIIISKASNGEIVYVNTNACDLLNLSASSLINRPIWDCYIDILDWQYLLQLLSETGTVDNQQICCHQADNSDFWVAISLRLLQVNGESVILSILWDISRFKQTELELKEAKEQLEAVLGAIPGYVSWVDTQGRYLGVNSYLAESFNLDSKDFVGRELGFMKGGKEFAVFIEDFSNSQASSASRVIQISIHNRTRSYLVAARKYKQNQEIVLVGIDITERQQAEEALKQTNDQLQAVLDAVPGLVSWFDIQGNYLGINQHLATKFNLSASTFKGRKVGFIEGNSQFSDLIYQFLNSPYLRTSQVVAIAMQGDLRYYLIAAQKYQQSQAAVCVGIDVTEHKKAEQALYKSEERFRSLVANIPGAIYRCQIDPTWKMEFISNTIADISGYFASDFINNEIRTYASIIHPEDQSSVQQRIQDAIAAKEPYNLEYRIIDAEGNIHWVYEQGRGVCDVLGNLLCLDGAIFDVSDRKQAQESLRIAEENYRSIFENALEGIFQSSPDGYYLRVNPAMAQIYGYNTPADMIANVTDISHQIYVNPDVREELKIQLQSNGAIKNCEYQAYRQDGTIIWVEEDTRVVHDINGNILYYEGIIQDITERKIQEQNLKEQLKALKIEIDEQKKAQEVAKITQSDYFQELKAELEQLRTENFFDD